MSKRGSRWMVLMVGLTVAISCRELRAMRGSVFDEDKFEPDKKDSWQLFDLRNRTKKNKASSALMEAVVDGQYEIVKLLIEKGADVNAKDRDGWTALLWAIHYEYPEIIKLLVENGADINVKTPDGRTPLTLAIRADMHDTSKYLINKGADVDTKNRATSSVLGMAIRDEQPEIAKLMIEKNVFLMGCPRSKKFPLVIAHRGDSTHCPENTMAAFHKAVAEGADMIEFDVRQSADGEFVVIHDATLDRTTNGTGEVSAKTLEELRTLDAGSWFDSKFAEEKIPVLKEVFKEFKDKTLFNVEVKIDSAGLGKNDEALEALIGLIGEQKLYNSVIVSCFDYQTLRDLRRLSDKVNLAVLSDAPEKRVDLVPLTRGVLATSYHPNWKWVTPEMVSDLHKKGVMVMPWALADDDVPETMRKMLEYQVDGFHANDPAALKAIFKPEKTKPDKTKEK